MLNIIPQEHKLTLSLAIAKGDFDFIRDTVEENTISPNAYEERFYTPLLMDVLTSYGIKDEEERLRMLRFFLEKGADPNLNCKAGYNSLHIAVQQESLIKALDLFLDFGGDVNLADKNGATVAYWAIQGFPGRTEGEERKLHLKVLEKIFLLGADLDYKNKFGVTPRQWLEKAPEDVQALATKCELLNPVYKPGNTVQPEFPTKLKYPEIASYIRANLIPLQGKAETSEGEMLRGLDNLRDEAQRNGNINFHQPHQEYVKFISATLNNAAFFSQIEKDRITASAKKLMHAKKPYLDDDIYDDLTDQICLYYQKNNPGNTEEKKWWKFWN